jgi:hypothetical protein
MFSDLTRGGTAPTADTSPAEGKGKKAKADADTGG